MPRARAEGGPAAERQKQDRARNPARALKVVEERAEHDAGQFTPRRGVVRAEHVEQDRRGEGSEGRQPANPERKRQQAGEAEERHHAIVD